MTPRTRKRIVVMTVEAAEEAAAFPAAEEAEVGFLVLSCFC
jgi:hypothetical protein